MDTGGDMTDSGPPEEGVGVPPGAGYSSVLGSGEMGSPGGRTPNGGSPGGGAAEYPGVPGGEEGDSTPTPSAGAPDVPPAGAPPKPDPNDFWQRMVATGTFKTVEQARNALDRRDWKDVERAKRLAERARESPGRVVPEGMGRVARRAYRQVNVKLSEPDFLALKALAIDRDMPPATMARLLIRKAIAEEAG